MSALAKVRDRLAAGVAILAGRRGPCGVRVLPDLALPAWMPRPGRPARVTDT